VHLHFNRSFRRDQAKVAGDRLVIFRDDLVDARLELGRCVEDRGLNLASSASMRSIW
jgi:hypothetical protein